MKFWHQQWTDKVKAIVTGIRADMRREHVSGERDPSQITARAKFGAWWEKIKADEDLLRHLAARAFYEECRSLLKEGDEGYSGEAAFVTEEQLLLWPTEHHRSLVRDIERTRLNVPSRGEYVEVDPREISPAEMIEAGKALIVQGKATIARGERCVELGELGGWEPKPK